MVCCPAKPGEGQQLSMHVISELKMIHNVQSNDNDAADSKNLYRLYFLTLHRRGWSTHILVALNCTQFIEGIRQPLLHYVYTARRAESLARAARSSTSAARTSLALTGRGRAYGLVADDCASSSTGRDAARLHSCCRSLPLRPAASSAWGIQAAASNERGSNRSRPLTLHSCWY